MSTDAIYNALRLAGELATITRLLVGGRDFTTGAERNSAPIELAAMLIPKVRDALDAYDDEIKRTAYEVKGAK